LIHYPFLNNILTVLFAVYDFMGSPASTALLVVTRNKSTWHKKMLKTNPSRPRPTVKTKTKTTKRSSVFLRSRPHPPHQGPHPCYYSIISTPQKTATKSVIVHINRKRYHCSGEIDIEDVLQ